ncbi:MAG: hypothetical protein HY709_04810 [Candidatus Latescibacteria bacterium]|nr:hypothetical protein [Candidatus Latescibacterota bacterium]
MAFLLSFVSIVVLIGVWQWIVMRRRLTVRSTSIAFLNRGWFDQLWEGLAAVYLLLVVIVFFQTPTIEWAIKMGIAMLLGVTALMSAAVIIGPEGILYRFRVIPWDEIRGYRWKSRHRLELLLGSSNHLGLVIPPGLVRRLEWLLTKNIPSWETEHLS